MKFRFLRHVGNCIFRVILLATDYELIAEKLRSLIKYEKINVNNGELGRCLFREIVYYYSRSFINLILRGESGQ